MIQCGILLVLGTYVCVTSAGLPPCTCTREYFPMCGSDGQTYPNPCIMECAKVTNPGLTAKAGPCETNEPLCICTYDYNPVCGTDGRTYSNQCQLNCQKSVNPTLEVKQRGECRKADLVDTCICTNDYTPVCGTNGVTYPNECSLNCGKTTDPNIEVKHQGECQKVAVEPVKVRPLCFCPKLFKQVCGTDSITYDNPCQLKCASRADSSIDFAYYGPCEVKRVARQQPCICTREAKPVCGVDGRTYGNECMLNCVGVGKSSNGRCP